MIVREGCSILFFDYLQRLKYIYNTQIIFEYAQVAGASYCFDEQGNVTKGTEGYNVRFDYSLVNLEETEGHLRFILF